ncbi:MAG: putative dithiol-disulfide isomerase involved in polyketide biosynthesis, partial [Actinomycetia bacterium]|nr:putative dithiol-disulfide isomerase involved in polyketide biosynthesis [Actinomycetes bacterium]
PLQTVAKEHTEAVDRWGTWGVPTFCPDDADAGVFIRFMERGRVDDLHRALELLDWERMNEFKRTRVPR